MAGELARSPLVGVDTRWEHTRGVAAQAEAAAAAVGVERRDVLVSAAWLHDVGYAPGCVATGLHPLDGATHLAQRGDVPLVVCELVAHHSGADVEAAER